MPFPLDQSLSSSTISADKPPDYFKLSSSSHSLTRYCWECFQGKLIILYYSWIEWEKRELQNFSVLSASLSAKNLGVEWICVFSCQIFWGWGCCGSCLLHTSFFSTALKTYSRKHFFIHCISTLHLSAAYICLHFELKLSINRSILLMNTTACSDSPQITNLNYIYSMFNVFNLISCLLFWPEEQHCTHN